MADKKDKRSRTPATAADLTPADAGKGAEKTAAASPLILSRQKADSYVFVLDDSFSMQTAQKQSARDLAAREGVFCEPASAASVAGLLTYGAPEGVERIVCVLTGHGLKDPQWALRNADGTQVEPTVVDATTSDVASVLGLRPSEPVPTGTNA